VKKSGAFGPAATDRRTRTRNKGTGGKEERSGGGRKGSTHEEYKAVLPQSSAPVMVGHKKGEEG